MSKSQRLPRCPDGFAENVAVLEVSRLDVEDFVEAHYLGVFPSSSQLYLGVFYEEIMVGMLIYGSPTAGDFLVASICNAVKSGPRVWQCGNHRGHSQLRLAHICELKRLFLTDNNAILPLSARQNLAGYAIKCGNKVAAGVFPNAKVVVTYSDSAHHQGTVYVATNAIFQGERSGKKRWLYPIGSPSQRKWVRKHIRQVNQRAHRTAGVLSILGGREEVVAAAAAAVEEQVEKERLHLRSETPGVFQTHEAGPKEMEGKGEESGQGQDVDPLV